MLEQIESKLRPHNYFESFIAHTIVIRTKGTTGHLLQRGLKCDGIV